MPSEIENIAAIVSGSTGIEVRIDPARSAFQGKNHSSRQPVAQVAGMLKPGEGFQITLELATIPPEVKIQTAPILLGIFGTFPGIFTVKGSPEGATIYYRLQYPASVEGFSHSIRMIKDLEQVIQFSHEIHQYLPVRTSDPLLKSAYEGISDVEYVEPLSPMLVRKVHQLFGIDPNLMLDTILGRRVLFLKVDHCYFRDLILGWMAFRLQDWQWSIGRLRAYHFLNPELLFAIEKVPFALSADLTGYGYQHSRDEVGKLAAQIEALGRPVVLTIPPGDPFSADWLGNGTIISLRNTPVSPDLWLDYFMEKADPAISRQEQDKIRAEILPDMLPFGNRDLTPLIIRSTLDRYLNRRSNKNDHLKSISEYLIKIMEL